MVLLRIRSIARVCYGKRIVGELRALLADTLSVCVFRKIRRLRGPEETEQGQVYIHSGPIAMHRTREIFFGCFSGIFDDSLIFVQRVYYTYEKQITRCIHRTL